MKEWREVHFLRQFTFLSDKLEGSLKHFSLILFCFIKNYVPIWWKTTENNGNATSNNTMRYIEMVISLINYFPSFVSSSFSFFFLMTLEDFFIRSNRMKKSYFFSLIFISTKITVWFYYREIFAFLCFEMRKVFHFFRFLSFVSTDCW